MGDELRREETEAAPLHDLKTWPPHFRAIAEGRKRFEVRYDADRGFDVGDLLLLREWDPQGEDYTGRRLVARATYMLEGGRFGILEEYVCMSIEVLPESETAQILSARGVES